MDLARIELGVEAQSYDLARSDVNACCTGRLQAQYLALVDLFEHSAAQPRRALGLPAEGPLDHKRIQTAFRCKSHELWRSVHGMWPRQTIELAACRVGSPSPAPGALEQTGIGFKGDSLSPCGAAWACGVLLHACSASPQV